MDGTSRRRGRDLHQKILLASGSQKETAKQYGVSYPPVRLKFDKLIQKIKIAEEAIEDSYIAPIKRRAVTEKMDFSTAKLLITAYKKQEEAP